MKRRVRKKRKTWSGTGILKSSSNQRLLVFGVAIAVALTFLLVYLRRHSQATLEMHSDPTSATSSSQQVRNQPVTAVAIVDKSSAPVNDSKHQKITNLLRTGLVRITAIDDGKTLVIPVMGKRKKFRCNPGDFDLLKSIAGGFDEKNLLLTLEPLHDSSAPSASQRFTLTDILSNKIWLLSLKKQLGPKDYAVMICLDMQNSGTCLDKSPIPSTEWNSYMNNVHREDRLLYSQTITIRQNEAYLVPSAQWNAETIEKNKIIFKDFLEDSNRTLSHLAKRMTVLGSLPGQATAKSLVLPLTETDSECFDK